MGSDYTKTAADLQFATPAATAAALALLAPLASPSFTGTLAVK